MTPEEVISLLFGVPVAEVTDMTAREDIPKWDSLGHVNLVIQLEATFGVTLTTDDSLGMKSVEDVKRILTDRGAAW